METPLGSSFQTTYFPGSRSPDEDIPNDEQDSPHDGQDNDVYKGPLTRARALLQGEVNLVLNECEHFSIKNCLLLMEVHFLSK